jgi:hypothetical protein
MTKTILAGLLSYALVAPASAQSEVPAGTRFLVELRDKLEAHKVKRGKKFEARTLEALKGSDGRAIPAGAKLKGKVSYIEGNRMVLRFEEIQGPRGKEPVVATVVRVVGERHVEANAGREGEIRADSSRGRDAAIGALIVGGIGAAAGAAKGGGKGGAIGGAAGAATGAAIGAAAGGRELVLQEGARLELQLDRPLTFRS